ncbi:MAG: hypothetical protein K2X34_08465 [Hyphomonadaceae bacterium]|nr:hypothetical protein [Hyphomonadaceae bacterium]
MDEEAKGEDRGVTRSEAAEYLHDMSGQLAEMARRFGLASAAEALAQAQRAVEAEF